MFQNTLKKNIKKKKTKKKEYLYFYLLYKNKNYKIDIINIKRVCIN